MKAPLSVVLSRLGERLVCDVVVVPGWEGFEKLCAYLEHTWSAVRVSEADGPDARRCVFRVRDVVVAVEFEDPWGNRIVASSSSANEVLSEIAADLQRRFAVAPE